MSGLEHPGVLDAFAHDSRADRLVLAMYEDRPWLGEDIQLFQFQEKLNAYVSFVLDGELNEAYPELAGKGVEIQLRTVHEPDAKAFDLIRRVREQLDLQRITFEVIRIDEEKSGCGDPGCGCR
ncbi:MAG: DUF6572 domain-containing protein [Terrimicrobiaceae bacterium]|jgi:hypothetical protein